MEQTGRLTLPLINQDVSCIVKNANRISYCLWTAYQITLSTNVLPKTSKRALSLVWWLWLCSIA